MVDSPTKAKTPPRPRKRRWLFAIALVILALLAAESIVRLAGIGPPRLAPRTFAPGGSVPFEVLSHDPQDPFFVYRPGVTFSSIYDPAGDARHYLQPGGRVDYRINAARMRGPLPSKSPIPGALKVLCLGDSITFGEGVHEPDTFPSQLQSLLAARSPEGTIEVINAGVQGYGTRQSLRFFRDYCRRLQPNVVILGFFLNDAMPAGQTIRHNDDLTRGLLPSRPARIFRIWDIVEHACRVRTAQNGWFADIRSSFGTEEWEACHEALRRFHAMSKEDGFRFLVVVFPVLWQLDGDYPFTDLHDRIASACDQSDIEHLDLLETLRAHSADSLWVHPTDHHPNELAHKLAAESIADHLETVAAASNR